MVTNGTNDMSDMTDADRNPGAGSAAVPIGEEFSVKDLVTGASFPLRAALLVLRTPSLRTRVLLMSLAAFVCLVVLAAGLFWAAPALVDALWNTADAWYARTARTLLKIAAYAALFAVGAFTLPSLVLIPLTDPLSEAAERAMGLKVIPQTLAESFRATWRSLINMLLRGLVFAAGHLLLLPLNLIPGVGGALWSCLAWLWSAVWIALAQLDVPMARHLRPFADAFRAFAARKLLFLGFGSGIYVLLWVPILNAMLVPLAVVASTMLMCSLEDAGVLLPRPEDAGGQGAHSPTSDAS